MAKRSSTRKESRKGSKSRKGTRKLGRKASAWNELVMRKYREMKKRDPNTRLGDAMQAAKAERK